MIRVESRIKPVEEDILKSYDSLNSSYELMPPLKDRPSSRILVLPYQKHALVLRKTVVDRYEPEEKLTAIVIEDPNTPISTHLASFTVTRQGLTNISLPAEYVFLDDIQTRANTLNFTERYNPHLSAWMVSWFQYMLDSREFTKPPNLFVCSADVIY